MTRRKTFLTVLALLMAGLLCAEQTFAGELCQRRADGRQYCSDQDTNGDGRPDCGADIDLQSLCRTRTGGALWGGSITRAFMEFGDESAFLVSSQSACSSDSVKAQDFFDMRFEPRNKSNTVTCRYTPNPIDFPLRSTLAKCKMEITCHCFRIGNCVSGRRTNQMKCPTDAADPNVAGCTGIIYVDPIPDVTDLKILPSPDGVTGVKLELKRPADLAERTDCAAAFPADSSFNGGRDPFAPESLGVGVIGEIEQVCSGGFSKTDPVVGDKLRGFAETVPLTKESSAKLASGDIARKVNFKLETKWAEDIAASCAPSSVDGPSSCPASSAELWITVAGRLPKGFDPKAAVDSPGLLKCSTSEAPHRCRIDGGGKLQCLCPICDPATGEYLVNENLYTLSQVHADPKWSAICPVTLNVSK